MFTNIANIANITTSRSQTLRKMKTCNSKIISIMALVALLMLAPACRRASDNGLIDGLWRIDSIEYNEPGQQTETVRPDGHFIAIQLELLQLDNYNPVATAIISYDKDASTIGLDFPYNPEPDVLRRFGIMENPCVLSIKTVSHKHLVLTSPTSTITCTRF